MRGVIFIYGKIPKDNNMASETNTTAGKEKKTMDYCKYCGKKIAFSQESFGTDRVESYHIRCLEEEQKVKGMSES